MDKFLPFLCAYGSVVVVFVLILVLHHAQDKGKPQYLDDNDAAD
jgi:hypothetical protein